MGRIEAMDWGAYAHFRFQARQHEELMPFMHAGYAVGSVLGAGVVLLVAMLLLLGQRRTRAVFALLLTVVAALLAIELVHLVVPRRRPPDAENIVGSADMLASYPATGVCLFLLAAIFLGYAVWPVLRTRWGRVVFLVVAAAVFVWICLSQFFLAVHFVTDVIGAIAGGMLFAWIALRLMSRAKEP